MELKRDLPEDVIKSGTSFETRFTIKKEALEKGVYKIVFDMVRENRAWFEAMGSLPLNEYFVIEGNFQ